MRGEPEAAHTDQGRPFVEITVDGRPLTLENAEATPNEILGLAGLDPTANYLVRIEGRHQFSFEGRGDEPIHVHLGEKFVLRSATPCPRSARVPRALGP